MSWILAIAAALCALIAAASAFGWFGVTANYNGFLALAVVLLALAIMPWPAYFRR